MNSLKRIGSNMPQLRLNQLIQTNHNRYPNDIFVRPSNPTQRLTCNQIGRDYYVGDIHGEFSLLEKALSRVSFDYEKDRLIAVGDLIDRGKESARVLEYLQQKWFFSVMGNHDYFLIDSVHHLTQPSSWAGVAIWRRWVTHGGWWTCDQADETLIDIAKLMHKRPLMLEIEYPNDVTVGVVHGELPLGMRWEDAKRRLVLESDTHSLAPTVIRSLLWGRERVTLWKKDKGDFEKYTKRLPQAYFGQGSSFDYTLLVISANKPIDDIDLIFCGHTAHEGGYVLGNIHYIDEAVVFHNGEHPFNLWCVNEQGVPQKA